MEKGARPHISEKEIFEFIRDLYKIDGKVKLLNSYIDQNFLITSTTGEKFVFKVTNSAERKYFLDAQHQVMTHLAQSCPDYQFPKPITAVSGEAIHSVSDKNGVAHFVQMLTFVEGKFLSEVSRPTSGMFYQLGNFLAKMDIALADIEHPAVHRELDWDLKNTLNAYQNISIIEDTDLRRLMDYFFLQFETEVLPLFPLLRKSLIHNDGNDNNILVRQNFPDQVVGIIDFGDMVYTYLINELAIALAYVMFEKDDPLKFAAQVVAGYNEILPLTEQELGILYYLIAARLCISLTMSGLHKKLEPENDYIFISEKPARELLNKLIKINLEHVYKTFRNACGLSLPSSKEGMDKDEILQLRERYIGKSLSISYRMPLKIVRGALQYLYDETGRAFLDAVNNVPHVGHCHPNVVRAAQKQMALLNTNTRYLHDYLVQYAGRLSDKLPEPLEVCFFVNSGSEANELALRLARNFTQQKDIIVVDSAYHGNTTAVIEISPYKFDGPGGSGAEPYIHKVETPDIYRGRYRASDPQAGKKYAEQIKVVLDQIQTQGKNVAAFICEPLMGVAGQLVLPDGYLKEAFQHVRAAGGICIADEVQIGFGRVGTHFWGFETQNAVPDIVTLGKPIGNGHPLAAVVTTREIADAFANGMEYFNTFGGNPVSCIVGLTVLDVIEQEGLQENAKIVGAYLKEELVRLKEKHSLIGDVRGAGLFIGIELVRNHETLKPADQEATTVIELMKERGVLISTDGPFHNVLKIKPPLVFNKENARFLVENLDQVIMEIEKVV